MVMLYLSFNLVLHFRHIKVYILKKLVQIKNIYFTLHNNYTVTDTRLNHSLKSET